MLLKNDSAAKRLKHALSLPRGRAPGPSHTATKPAACAPSSSGGPVVVQARELGRAPATHKDKSKSKSKKKSNSNWMSATSVIKKRSRSEHGARAAERIENAAQFVDKHRRDVGRFGAQALEKRDKKAYEADELVRLGCRRPKNAGMPIGLLQHRRAKQQKREAEKRAADLESGVLVRSNRGRRR